MSWNNNKKREQPKRKGLKGQKNFKNNFHLYFILIYYNIAWEDEEEVKKPKYTKPTINFDQPPSNESNVNQQKKSAYEIAYNSYNTSNNITNNPISKNDYLKNPEFYKTPNSNL